jgi:short-subunit dehydrogenase
VLQLAAELKGKAGDIDIMPTDMSDSSAIDALAKTVLEKYGGIDILVNNAVSAHFGSRTALQPEGRKGCECLWVNVHAGAVMCCCVAAGHPGSQWRQPAGGRPR